MTLCTGWKLEKKTKQLHRRSSSCCLVFGLFSSLQGNWNICCSSGFETATPCHPFLTLTAFHLRQVMFSHSHFTFGQTFLLFLFSWSFCGLGLNFLWVGLLSLVTVTTAALYSLHSLFYVLLSFLVLNHSYTLDNREDLAWCLSRLSGICLGWGHCQEVK